jgi:hypothetical protein
MDKKFILVPHGPLIQGIHLKKITDDVAKALEDSDVVILKGQANFEMSQALAKPHYNLFIVKGYTNMISTGFDSKTKPYMFARIDPILAPFGNYAPQGMEGEYVYWSLPNYYLRLYHRGILPWDAFYLERERSYEHLRPGVGVNFLVLREYVEALYEHNTNPSSGIIKSNGEYTDAYRLIKEKFEDTYGEKYDGNTGTSGLRQLNKFIIAEAWESRRNLYEILKEEEKGSLTFLGEIVSNHFAKFKDNNNISPENLMNLLYFNYLLEQDGRSLIAVVSDIADHLEEINEIFNKYTEQIVSWEDAQRILQKICSNVNSIRKAIERVIRKSI